MQAQGSLEKMHRQNHTEGEWLYIWITACIIIAVFQIAIIALPDSVYWCWYDTSSDVFEVLLSFALYSAVSYRAVSHKALSIGLSAWCFYSFLSNVITDYFSDQIEDVFLSSIFMMAALIIIFSFRFLLRFHINHNKPEVGKFYELRGRPESLSQALVAVYTGEAGSFGITDGEYLWHYSKPHGALIQEALKPWHTNNKMCKKICNVFSDGHVTLEKITGHQFTFIQNCLELRALARSWRKKNV